MSDRGKNPSFMRHHRAAQIKNYINPHLCFPTQFTPFHSFSLTHSFPDYSKVNPVFTRKDSPLGIQHRHNIWFLVRGEPTCHTQWQLHYVQTHTHSADRPLCVCPSVRKKRLEKAEWIIINFCIRHNNSHLSTHYNYCWNWGKKITKFWADDLIVFLWEWRI